MQLGEEDSLARLGEGHFLQAASSKCKAVDWLLLNARKSRMCQACAAGERGRNQPKTPYRQQQSLQDFYCPLAVGQLVITGQATLSVLAAGDTRGTASGKM